MHAYLKRYAAFDTETTGLGDDARIAQIAVVRFANGRVVEQYQALCNPGDIDWDKAAGALKVNGLTREQLEDAASYEDALPTIAGMLEDQVCVAHNAAFDARMMSQEFNHTRERVSFWAPPRAILDTLLLDFALSTGYLSRKLGACATRWGVEPSGAHEALADATTAGLILAQMADVLPATLDECLAMQAAAGVEWEQVCARARARDKAREKLDI